MIVTICQIHDGKDPDLGWRALVRYAHETRSDLVLLPELPFASAFLSEGKIKRALWDRAVDAHDRAETRFADLAPAMVVGTRPLDFGNNRYEEGFVWSAHDGFRGIHARSQAESRSGMREGEWFEDAAPDFVPVPTGDAVLGFLIGSELWRADEATRYRRENVDLLVAPRLPSSVDPEGWLAAGRAAAIAAGAFCLSSVRADDGDPAACAAWAFDPHGELI